MGSSASCEDAGLPLFLKGRGGDSSSAMPESREELGFKPGEPSFLLITVRQASVAGVIRAALSHLYLE
jgi:hypothetical protein